MSGRVDDQPHADEVAEHAPNPPEDEGDEELDREVVGEGVGRHVGVELGRRSLPPVRPAPRRARKAAILKYERLMPQLSAATPST
jgi:hypothetical protein